MPHHLSHQATTLIETYSAHNYHPLPVVIARGEGVWLYDTAGKRYLDMLAAYSAINFGHKHQDLVATAHAQLDTVTLTSRAFYNDQLGPFCKALAALCRMEMVLPMNTGAEAVETAIKTARKWGYLRKQVAPMQANIIVCSGNFHGRTTTIISFSGDAQARNDFGPYTPGFITVPYGDAAALEAAIDANTVGFLFEPIQGEAGVIIPQDGYLREVRDICSKHHILMIADEIQSGLGRTGTTFACEHEQVQPDMYILGKALGGGIVPLSAVVSSCDILGVFKAGEHGSTFGGNPLACAIGQKVIELLQTNYFQQRSLELGNYFLQSLRRILQQGNQSNITAIRGRGLWAGIDLRHNANITARTYCESLMHAGLLCKDTHVHTIRLAPPLVIDKQELDWAVALLGEVLLAA